jgi:multidrug resistance efflux pump
MATAKATLENIQAQTAETMTRVQQNQVETQLLPIEEETKRISALAKTMPTGEFEKVVKFAELQLKEKELDTKEEMVKMQMKGNN